MACWWIRWDDLNWPNPDSYEKIKNHAEALANAGTTTVVLFGTHFRWDYLPFFHMLNDYIATVAEECHKRGMELWDHHSVNLVHRHRNREEFVFLMKNSGPHLPFSPSYEAAATWQYKGSYLNDWRLIDTVTREPYYFPQYQAEGFCIANPEYLDAYMDYAKELVRETEIDGLMADDSLQWSHFKTCACPVCRRRFKERSGIDLPEATDTNFWGNFDNPAWNAWIDYRMDIGGEFHERLKKEMPEGFLLSSCGIRSAHPRGNSIGADARQFLRGDNYVNLEISGNTPPCNDPLTTNFPVADNVLVSAHHIAAAREKGARCYATGYGFCEDSAGIIWAINKSVGADAWFCTLKQRLGLPDHILNTLPDEQDLVARPFLFEKAHPELFLGDSIPETGIYFSYETRKHTLFGSNDKGYYADYTKLCRILFQQGTGYHVLFDFPKDTSVFKSVIVPSPLKMTDAELSGLEAYRAAGGKLIVSGPAAIPGCNAAFKPKNRVDLSPEDFHIHFINNGLKLLGEKWMSEPIPVTPEENKWTEVTPGLFYNPVRFSTDEITDSFRELLDQYLPTPPMQVVSQEGYLVSAFKAEDAHIFHFLAAEYDAQVDEELDKIRYHRSRVNLIRKAPPIHVSREILMKATTLPTVYTPLTDGETSVAFIDSETVKITLPESTAYAIVYFA